MMTDTEAGRLNLLLRDLLRLAGSIEARKLPSLLRNAGYPHYTPEDCRAAVDRIVQEGHGEIVSDGWLRERVPKT